MIKERKEILCKCILLPGHTFCLMETCFFIYPFLKSISNHRGEVRENNVKSHNNQPFKMRVNYSIGQWILVLYCCWGCFFLTHYFPLIVQYCLLATVSTLLYSTWSRWLPSLWYPIVVCLWLINSCMSYLQQLYILQQIYRVINSVWMWGAAHLNPAVDILMITTINADGFNGPLSECLSCSAVLNNNSFVPQNQHGQKVHFLSSTCCCPLDSFIGPQNEQSDDRGGPRGGVLQPRLRHDFQMHL